MTIRVGVTSGIHVGGGSELTGPIKKLGYTLTRGVDCVELAANMAHEVSYSDGAIIRHIAKKQAVNLFFHGDLHVPFGVPERIDWRDAFDRMTKSMRSAIFIGARYVVFHASVTQWLELLTYTSHKMTFSFVDHRGQFISDILYEEPKLREWFLEKKVDGNLLGDILTHKDRDKISKKLHNILDEPTKKLSQMQNRLYEINKKIEEGKAKPEDQAALTKEFSELQNKATELQRKIEELRSEENRSKVTMDVVKEKLSSSNRAERHWENEDIRSAGISSVIDGHHIMAHYLFYKKDPMWLAMVEQYKDVLGRYNLNYSDMYWLDTNWYEAERNHDKEFKEFYYAVVTAKYMEGLIERAMAWVESEFIKKEIPKLAKFADDPKKEEEELTKNARKLIIAIENGDARDAEHAGMHLLWRPKQIYAAVKTTRRILKTDRVRMIVDHEHLATQGLDALIESRETIKKIPDFGELVISVHSNHPNPLHSHDPIEHGDVVLYELLWNLRSTGFGKKGDDVYLIFERGGGDDPFQRSVDALRIIARFLEKDVTPGNLPVGFFGLQEMAGDESRQLMIIMDHKMEPIKDLLEMSEEDWGMLSRVAREKGKAEAFKKGELK